MWPSHHTTRPLAGYFFMRSLVPCYVALGCVLAFASPAMSQQAPSVAPPTVLFSDASPASQRAAFLGASNAARLSAAPQRFIVVYREAGASVTYDPRATFPGVRAGIVEQARSRVRARPGVRNERSLGKFPVSVVEVDRPEDVVALLDDPNVAFVEVDHVSYLSDTPASSVGEMTESRAETIPWGVAMVGAPAAWALGARGQGVKVGILDSGGDNNHFDLQFAGGASTVGGGGLFGGGATVNTDPSAWADTIAVCNSHGTHVAGTVGARANDQGVVGVAPEVSLYAIRVFEGTTACSAFSSSQIAGIDWAVTQGIQILNASIGGSFSTSYQTAVNTARAAGTLFIASSGNDSRDGIRCPSCYNASLSIGAINSSKGRPSWSNFGAGLSYVAPGEGILSTLTANRTGNKSGTSMASPHAVGVVALLLSAGLTLDQALDRLALGAEDLNAPGWDPTSGSGLVRADLALGITPGGSAVSARAALPLVRFTGTVGTTLPANGALDVILDGAGLASTGWYPQWQVVDRFLRLNDPSGFLLQSSNPLFGTQRLVVTSHPEITTLPAGVYVDTLLIRRAGTNEILGSIPTELILSASGATPLNATLTAVAPSFSSVRADSAAPSGSGTLTLTGSESTTASWSASSTSRFAQVTTPTGVGNGTVRWDRSVPGTPGVYVDTIRVNITSTLGTIARLAIDTLEVRSAPTSSPLVLALAPQSRSRSVMLGTVVTDSVALNVTGTGADTATWTASGIGLSPASLAGTGSGWVPYTWTASTPGLVVGSLNIQMGTLTATMLDSMTVLTPLSLAVAPPTRTTPMLVNTTMSDSIEVLLAGTGADTATWTAAAPIGITLGATSGVGTGWLSFTRLATAEGTLSRDIVITAGPLTATATDIAAVTTPIALSLAPEGGAHSTLLGVPHSDSLFIQITGTLAAGQPWTAVTSTDGLTLGAASGTGPSWLTFDRVLAAEGLALGTITVSAGGLVATYTDSATGLVATTLTLAPSGRSTVSLPDEVTQDSVQVVLAGSNAATAAWTASLLGDPHITLGLASGTGSGWLPFSRATSAPLSVATIQVSSEGSDAFYADTLRAVTPRGVVLSASSRRRVVLRGSAAAGDSVIVSLSGTGSDTATWSASSSTPGLVLTGAGGGDGGYVRWTRQSDGGGVQVGVIAVASGGASAEVVDTLIVSDGPPGVDFAEAGRRRSVSLDSARAWFSQPIVVFGDGRDTLSWSVVSRSSGLSVRNASGQGSGAVDYRWSGATAAGTLIGSLEISMPGVSGGATALFVDTVTVTVPVVAVNTAVRVDSATLVTRSVPGRSLSRTRTVEVALLGVGGEAAKWRMRRLAGAGNVSVSTAWRIGSGPVSFTTSHGSGTPEGEYVDTLIVERLDVMSQPALVIHTLNVTSALEPLVAFGVPRVRTIATPDERLVDPVRQNIGFVVTPPPGALSTAWQARSSARLNVSSNTRSGDGPAGMVGYTRGPLPTVPGWYVDTLVITVLGREHALLDSLLISATPPARTDPLTIRHGVTSRYWTAPEGTVARLNARMAVIPEGPGSDTTLWRTRVWTSSPGHAGTGAGISAGTRNLIVWVDLGLPAGQYVDTVQSSFLHDPQSKVISLDTLEIVPVIPVGGLRTGLPLIGVPAIHLGKGEVPVIQARGVRIMSIGDTTWGVSVPDAPVGATTLTVGIATAAPGEDVPSATRSIPVYRLSALPSRQQLLGAVLSQNSLVARWADAISDGDGHLTLGEVLRLLPELKKSESTKATPPAPAPPEIEESSPGEPTPKKPSSLPPKSPQAKLPGSEDPR